MTSIRRLLVIGASCVCLYQARDSNASPASPQIAIRGYYFTFCRMPTFGLEAWKEIFDGIHQDGGNQVLLWMGGGFRSKKFPVTWEYNREHKNIEADFARELIDYAHSKGIKVLLALTPFSYDGVNQFPLQHPELKATQRNGRLAKLSGIHCWGYALNPARAAAQRFMLEYAREMMFDFYPNADGLMIESSDYAICYCKDCKESYYQKEFQFVRQISEEIWARNSQAAVVVYPHYFTGRAVPGFDVKAAAETFDPRWTLFFTPHSAHIDVELLKQARTAIYWDSSPALKTPRQIQEGALKALQSGIGAFVPSLEGFSFVAEHPEGGEANLVGKRLKPFGFEWLAEGQNPYEELLIHVNRIAYREFTRDPKLAYADFQVRLGKEVFGSSADTGSAQDLLYLQESFFVDRSWFSASPLVSPNLLSEKLKTGSLSTNQLRDYQERLRRIKDIQARYARTSDKPRQEMHRIAAWITANWAGSEKLLSDHLRNGN